MSKQIPHINVTPADHVELSSWLKSTTLGHGLATRAHIILRLADGESPSEISRALGIARKTIYKWHNRYLAEGVEGLYDAPRSGRPTTINEQTVRKVLKMTCEQAPQESTHWSIALMSECAHNAIKLSANPMNSL